VIGIAWDMVNQVLRPNGQWSWGVKWPFIVLAMCALALALFMTAVLRPVPPHTLFGWFYPSNLFCSALIFELGAAIVITAHRFGLAWRHWVTGVAIGWMLWSFAMFLAEAGESYWPESQLSSNLDRFRMYAYLAAVCYWIFAFFQKEPERGPLPSKLRTVFSGSLVDSLKSAEKSR
jgi:hypothetical protein